MTNIVSYIGFFLILLALFNSIILVSSQPLLSKIDKSYQQIIFSASKIQFPIVLLSFICLIYSFLINDFSLKYVSSNSNSALPYFYKISASWAGHEGSLLLWCLILSFWMFLASNYSKTLETGFRKNFLSIMGGINLGFLLFLVFTSNPFEKNLSIPIDGKDLNPLLQDFGLIVHPPILYMGYVGLSVVFSFAITCCIHKEFKPEWANWIRPWVLASWSFLTLGIALGSWWAYYELGWGGWWFWDPVENASFMPWLMTTALIHSLIICEQKQVFKNWTILLSIFAFSLSLLGTFLVRSGILISVHSFANDPARGIFILSFLAFIIGGSLLIYFLNASEIKDKNKFGLVSKETFFLLNNILLVTATFTILLGTIYPLFLDLLGLEKISVGVPYYNLVFLPIMIPLVFLAGCIPILNFSSSNISKVFQSIGLTLILSILILYVFEKYSIPILIGLFLFFWVVINLIYDFIKRIFSTQSFSNAINNIGMYLAHIGLAVFILGATIVENDKTEKEIVMSIGDTVNIKEYSFIFRGMKENREANYDALIGVFDVKKEGKLITTLFPEKRLYFSSDLPMTEAGIEPGFTRDLYVTLGNFIDEDKWSVRIYHKPLVRLIWLGAILMALGGAVNSVYRRKRKL
tara:strand:- start:9081 stop:10985 length:1905 start_codon:yes stop_codon:yes gene_type:complete